MGKRLSIIRHAKSVNLSEGSDFDRSLNERGINDARLVGDHLLKNNYSLDAVYCSTAVRAQQTWNELNSFLNVTSQHIFFLDRFYLASYTTFTAQIENTDNRLNHIAVVGHNPGLTSLCNYYTGDDLYNLPTCGVYSISFLVDDWKSIGPGVGNKAALITPAMLKGQ